MTRIEIQVKSDGVLTTYHVEGEDETRAREVAVRYAPEDMREALLGGLAKKRIWWLGKPYACVRRDEDNWVYVQTMPTEDER